MPPRNSRSFCGFLQSALASGPSSNHWPYVLDAFLQLFYLTAKNADSPAEFPKLWFSIRPKDDKWGFHSRWWTHHENDIMVWFFFFFARRQGKKCIGNQCFMFLFSFHLHLTTVVIQNTKEEQKWRLLLSGFLGVCLWQGHTYQCPGHAFLIERSYPRNILQAVNRHPEIGCDTPNGISWGRKLERHPSREITTSIYALPKTILELYMSSLQSL